MARNKNETSTRFVWTGDAVHIPNWVIPGSDTNTLEPGREYNASDVPEGFDHPLMIPSGSSSVLVSSEASKGGEI